MKKFSKNKWPLFFTGINIVLFCLFFLLPAILGLYYSLTDYKGYSGEKFIGLANYMELLKDKSFYKALLRTAEYTIVDVPILYAVSLLVAVMLNNDKVKGKFISKIIFFLPWTISGIIAGVIWRWLFGENFGFINYVISELHGEPVPWFTNGNFAFMVIVFASVWSYTAFNMLQFMTALKNIPKSLYEAADIDGAKWIDKFRHITLPTLKPTSFMVILLATINAMKEFALIQSLTNGGPGTDNMLIVQYIYSTGFDKMRVGYASAASMVLFVVLLALGIIQMKIGGSSNEE
ncbi:carbohydrate ABC transporter permease [Clostridium saccharoperbutylacetonicum]|jgi:alpha-1,4-digalacturonate transport system permease protein|uniref:L-arabinose transport system permease protein AraP n=1 Tax=Clostridium saccharoperbutylacetonicum N1-4(HMT) TaxID=931276 RepID=M1MI40_9CLOT|nr:sugar ABC transporter permease [Clostridium saccharoperbutylacetonicum]AGF55993.1 L-arabinose transport system permease protein AraP [Clostridium saccharoperbutylacetonicum N1-4(HMT)]NRT63268.1 alpha-1,4-digalacturonate transport system permease protein [Clostridium saccharoperbutylacetonicum]NSB26630.1 alpha-1,4-digalacturonate transport system permease protein [Clostridium saccharoperbutylacetonicum]NSB45980.1 alpha-1,4-digalacturonate transport system permease protein [Clostridium sacchar